MITIFHDSAGLPQVWIRTLAEIESDQFHGLEHIPVPTDLAPTAAAFLDSLNVLSSDAASEIATLLTTIYKMGVEAGVQQHKARIGSTY